MKWTALMSTTYRGYTALNTCALLGARYMMKLLSYSGSCGSRLHPLVSRQSLSIVSCIHTLQFVRSLSQQIAQVLQVVTSCDSKLPYKVLGCVLQVAVVALGLLFFRASEVSIRRDGSRTVKALQPGLCFCLRLGVKCGPAKEFVR